MTSCVRLGVALSLVATGALTSGCGARSAPPAAGPVNEPRVSWLIRSGPSNAGERERERVVCSSDALGSCVLEASAEGHLVEVSVVVFLHPADKPTAYNGAVFAGFVSLGDQIGYESKVEYTVQPGSRPVQSSMAALVTGRPGDYPLRIALRATVAGHTDPHQISQNATVKVTPRR